MNMGIKWDESGSGCLEVNEWLLSGKKSLTKSITISIHIKLQAYNNNNSYPKQIFKAPTHELYVGYFRHIMKL